MKKITFLAMMAFVAFAPFLFTSCYEDHWYDDWSWRNGYWYGRYNYNNQGGNHNQNNNSTIEDEGACLIGTWIGEMVYTYLDDNGNKGQAQFNAEMIFEMNNNKSYTEGVGKEIDTVEGDSQTLSFTWYIDKSGNIFIRYNKTGKTFKLDVQSNTKGFYLDDKSFNGYMVASEYEEIEFSFTRGNNGTRRARAKSTIKTDTSNIPWKLVER
jgi:hypothetical protein